LVPPGRPVRLGDHDPADEGLVEFAGLRAEKTRDRADKLLEASRRDLARAQALLWANETYSVLVVLQAMDAAGKDGTIKHVMSGVNPQGCEVHSFRAPSEIDLDHVFLWRYWDKVPRRGRIGIFNRSYYEETLIARVHPDVLARQRLPPGRRDRGFWIERFEDINGFERHLVRNGTLVLKFFLNVSKSEQRRRLLERVEDPRKNWKFSASDLAEREFWNDYRRAYTHMLAATSTMIAPWYVIPADDKHVCRALVAALLAGHIDDLRLRYPEPSPEQRRRLQSARRSLRTGD
jgi:PPK2 family polyphosphate:nucleotide phosphotransferase